MGRAASPLLAACALTSVLACTRASTPPPPPPAADREWQLLASELPAALLSVSARSPPDVFAVGADKGKGPLVLHFDGKGWSEMTTGSRGDLWWVQAIPRGPVFMAGANATVLRSNGRHFERMNTPGLARQTVYGVWGTGKDDFYAVGSSSGRSGFIWHFHGGAFEKERLPLDLPRISGGEVPGFFKVFGMGGEVWVVGAGGTILHRRGASPFTVLPTKTKDTLFTVHGSEGRVVAVGGGGNGVIFDGNGAAFHAVSPPGAGLFQGIFTTPHGDWASGERGLIYHRDEPSQPFAVMDHGQVLPAASSLHAISVDPSGGVWSVGGNVLTPALDGGMLLHYGDPVPPVVIDGLEPEIEDAEAPPTTTTARTTAARASRAPRKSSPRGRRDPSREGGTSKRWPRSASISRAPPCTPGTSSTCRPRCGTPGRRTTRRRPASS